MKKLLLLILVLFCSTCIAGSIKEIIFFGDSLTDNGNIYKAILKIAPKSPPYYRGRFSNGPVWAEYLGKYYYDKGYLDYKIYAYGGATALPHLATAKFIPPTHLELEVTKYLVESAFKDKSQSLYSIWIGGNDYVFYSFLDGDRLTSNVVDKTAWAITKLISRGAKNFLILNLPDLTKLPIVISMGLEDKLQELVKLHNQKLADAIKRIQETYPNVNIVSIDIFSIFNDFINDPGKYNQKYHANIKNVTEACWKGGYVFTSLKDALNEDLEHTLVNNSSNKNNTDPRDIANFILNSPDVMHAYTISKAYEQGIVPCNNPDEHFFWDSIHPTQVVHKILGEIVAETLHNSAIPIN